MITPFRTVHFVFVNSFSHDLTVQASLLHVTFYKKYLLCRVLHSATVRWEISAALEQFRPNAVAGMTYDSPGLDKSRTWLT